MVKNLRESTSTLSLRPHLEVTEAHQRVTELEAQVERLQSMQRREMDSLSGSATTRNLVEDNLERDQRPRKSMELDELISNSRALSHPSLTAEVKPEKPTLAEWTREYMPNNESTSSHFTPSVRDNPQPRLPMLHRHESFNQPRLAELARAYNIPDRENWMDSRPSPIPMSHIEANKPAEQYTERNRWQPSFGGMERYMPTESGMGLNGSSGEEAEKSGTDGPRHNIPGLTSGRVRSFPIPVTTGPKLSHQKANGTTAHRETASGLGALPSAYRTNTQQPPEARSSTAYTRSPLVSPRSYMGSDSYPYESLSSWDEQPMRPHTETSLFEKFNQRLQEQRQVSKESLITKALAVDGYTLKAPEAYTQPFCDFLTENPTVFHAVDYFEKKLDKAGFKKLSERKVWTDELKQGGKYYVQRNGSSLIAFTVGGGYQSGNGVAMIAGHVDALTARLKPISSKKTSAGYVQLGVAPYAGGLNTTWWDRDLGIGGRVLVKDPSTGKITTKLVKLGWPIARIPTLAPHFGVGMLGQNNAETQAVPIIGLDNSDIGATEEEFKNFTLGEQGTFAATQPPRLVRAIAGELSIQEYSSIVNWELELYDIQPAQTGGLEKEFIFGGRIDDKLCSWAAMEGLLASAAEPTSDTDGIIKLVGVFDDEEIGSLLRQGAKGNFLPSVIERISETFSKNGSSANILSQTYANSFLVSADVTHAVNPNFLGSYLENHAPRLNVGLVVCADSNGHMTTDSVSTALLTRVAENCGSKLQVFMIRNDSRSGGTVGPMLSAAMGVRAIDAGIPQLSMHSIRATTGALDPGLGVKIFKGFLDNFEKVDAEFE